VTAEFSIKVEDIKARILPELNDEFAQSLGDYDDLEGLQKDIRESLEQRSDETYNSEYDDKVLDAIIEGSTIKYPPQMLENEISNVIQQLESRLANQGLDMDIYLKTRDLDEQGLRDETTPVAETRVNRSLVLLEIARKEEIEISDEDLQQETERTLNTITRHMSDTERKKFDTPNALMNLAGNIYAEMRMTRTLEYVRTVAKGDLEKETLSENEDENGTEETVTEAAEALAEDVQAEEKIVEHDELEAVQESEVDDEKSEDEQLSADQEEVKTKQDNTAE
jgi:trigger factor